MEERREGQGRDGKKRKDELNEVYQLKSMITFTLYLQTTNILISHTFPHKLSGVYIFLIIYLVLDRGVRYTR